MSPKTQNGAFPWPHTRAQENTKELLHVPEETRYTSFLLGRILHKLDTVVC